MLSQRILPLHKLPQHWPWQSNVKDKALFETSRNCPAVSFVVKQALDVESNSYGQNKMHYPPIKTVHLLFTMKRINKRDSNKTRSKTRNICNTSRVLTST